MAVMKSHSISPHTQYGSALIIFMLILLLAGTTALFSVLDDKGVKLERDKKTAAALAQAKIAVIAWAVKSATPGQLPCPEDTSLIDTVNEGTAKASCILPAIGRLPWKSLGIGDLRDGSNEKLWYAISAGFRTSPINSDTPAQLTVDGVAGSAVAIIFSPGSALGGQVRSIPTNASPPDVAQYLDLSNSDLDNTFVTLGAANSFNDRLLPISHKELFAVVEKRVANEVLRCLNSYASSPVAAPPPTPPVGTYPWPAILNPALPPTYVGTVNTFFGRVPDSPMGGNWSGSCSIPIGGTGWWLSWKEMVFFAIADGYKPTITTPLCGACLTVSPPSVVADKRVTVLVSGKKLGMQVRSSDSDKGTLTNYLEAPNDAGAVSFSQQKMTSTFNDIVVYR
jgi:hypothetical protein